MSFKISSVLDQRSFLNTIVGTVSILNSNITGAVGIGSTGPRGATGAMGITGPTGASSSGAGGDVLVVTDNTSSVSLSSFSTTIINYTQTGLNVALGTPTDSLVKTVILSGGSLSTNLTTGSGVFILSPGDTVQLLYSSSRWNVITRTDVAPLVQLAKYTGTGATGNAYQGTSVAFSSDASTLAIGGPNNNGGIGATWIYTRGTDGLYTQQGIPLIGNGNTNSSQQGYSVSLSSDGNTLAVGGYADANNIGATWIFVRSGGVWTQQAGPLVGTGISGLTSQQGYSVSLSANGNTLAVGGPRDDGDVGAVWVFTRSGGVWTQQSKLIGTGLSGLSRQGSSVSLSSDGNTLAIGATDDAANIGATWIWTRSGSIWTQQGNKLVANNSIGNPRQGWSVSLSNSGDILAVGAPYDNGFIGAVFIFARSGGVWTQTAKLVGTNVLTSSSVQGMSVALSSGGNTLIVGGTGDDGGRGAVWVWTFRGTTWTQRAKTIPLGIGTGEIGIGTGVAVSSDGGIMAIGSPVDVRGSATVFV